VSPQRALTFEPSLDPHFLYLAGGLLWRTFSKRLRPATTGHKINGEMRFYALERRPERKSLSINSAGLQMFAQRAPDCGL